MAIKNHDFVEIDYTGTMKDDNIVFDTTVEQVARDNGFYKEGASYKPAIICVGERQVVPGIDRNVIGKEIGQEYTFDLQPEEAFGKKDAKLLQLVPFSRFKKDNIQPFPGMQVNIDDNMGIIRTVSGGRILVDFNNPLAGKEVVYKIKINRIVENDEEKVTSLLEILGMQNAHIHNNNGDMEVVFGQGMPEEVSKAVEGNVKKLIPTVKSLKFVSEKEHKHEAEVKTEAKLEEKKENKKNNASKKPAEAVKEEKADAVKNESSTDAEQN